MSSIFNPGKGADRARKRAEQQLAEQRRLEKERNKELSGEEKRVARITFRGRKGRRSLEELQAGLKGTLG